MSREIENEDGDGGSTGAVSDKTAKADIQRGARALKELQRTAGHNWTLWSYAIRGWRGLKELAFKRAGVRDPKAQAYRDAMGALLDTAQGSDYKAIPTETRAAMNKLTERIDEVDAWHAALPTWDRERWPNPQTIVKHCPREFLTGQGHNRPRRPAAPKKKRGNPEAESLRAKFIRVVTKYVMPVDPEEAKKLLDDLYQTDPNDSLEGFGDDDAESDA
jgi:hypothetical protein